MRGQMTEIAQFLGIEVSSTDWDEIALYCSFDWMRAHGEKAVPLGGTVWEGGVSSFINRGVNGRWQSVLSDAESKAYEARAKTELGEDCAHWLATGQYA
jgi:aryl sulfotransferase